MGRPEMPSAEKAERGGRLRSLRERLRDDDIPGGPWTQEAVADRAKMLRTGYVKMEGGKSSSSGWSAARVAHVYKLHPGDFENYLRGALTLDEVLERRYPLAAEFIAKLDACSKLKAVLRKHPTRWHFPSVVRALSHVRGNEIEPEVGWASLLDAIESDRVDDEIAEENEHSARSNEKRIDQRPRVPGAPYRSQTRR